MASAREAVSAVGWRARPTCPHARGVLHVAPTKIIRLELLEAEFKVRNAPREVDWTHGLARCSFHPQRSVWADWW